jgi:predicted phosphoribosyltransferase
MQAALWAARRDQPASVVAAVPVGALDTVERLSGSADEIVCLRAPEDFGAVGRFYRRFDQVEDEEVLAILREHQVTPRS